MLNTILAILFAGVLGLVFKLWSSWNIRVLPAILHNYLACIAIAWGMEGQLPWDADTLGSSWFPWSIALSLCFVLGFYLFGMAVWHWGMGTMSAVQKMSMVLSTLVIVWSLDQRPAPGQWAGIALGIGAIALIMPFNRNTQGKTAPKSSQAWLIAGGSYLLAALIEIGLVFIERGQAESSGDPRIIATIFGGAFLWGSLVLMTNATQKRSFFTLRHMGAGWLLGIPNFFSIYYLMKAIGTSPNPGLVLPVINTGTILAAVLLGRVLFREPFTGKTGIGIVLAMAALVLLSYPNGL